MVDEVEIMIASHPRWLRMARSLVEIFCREYPGDAATVRAVVLAVDESLANIMKHAYGGDQARPIRVICRCDWSAVTIEICDDGREFNPFAQAVPPPDEMRLGGRGIFLISSVMDECEYLRENGWNRVRLTKRLPLSVAVS